MNKQLSFTKECLVYPGEYIPPAKVETFLQQFKSVGSSYIAKLSVNMKEYGSYYFIEVAIPGVKREDIMIHTEDNILSLVAIHKDEDESIERRMQRREFDAEYLERHLLLPDNADNEFIAAVFSDGILKLHIPKKDKPSNAVSTRVVVY